MKRGTAPSGKRGRAPGQRRLQGHCAEGAQRRAPRSEAVEVQSPPEDWGTKKNKKSKKQQQRGRKGGEKGDFFFRLGEAADGI